MFHLIISSIQQYQNYEKQEMKCIRKNYWKTSLIWWKWKEIWNKNIQQPNTKERNGISLSKERNISNGKWWVYWDYNNELHFLKNNSEYVFQTLEPQFISKWNNKSIRNTF